MFTLVLITFKGMDCEVRNNKNNPVLLVVLHTVALNSQRLLFYFGVGVGLSCSVSDFVALAFTPAETPVV